jgi:hypothetical protein
MAGLDNARAIVIEDLGEIPLVSVEFFIEHALPHVEMSAIHAINTSLQTNCITKRGRWSGFSKDPQNSGKKETGAFRGLPAIFKNIVDAASPILKKDSCLYLNINPMKPQYLNVPMTLAPTGIWS